MNINNKVSSVEYKPTKATGDDSIRYIYTYDDSYNLLIELHEEKLLSGYWYTFEKYTYTYNDFGDMLTFIYENVSNENQSFGNNARHTYTYDNNSNRLTELYEEWTNGNWAKLFRSTFIYNNNNNLVTELSESFLNDMWIYSWKRKYFYDDSGYLMKESYEQGNYFGMYIYTYDKVGNRLTNSFELRENDILKISWRITNSYDNNGNMLNELYEYWENKIITGGYKNIFTYDPDNNILTILTKNLENNTWVNSSAKTYTYDNNGNRLIELSANWVNNSWENNRRFTSAYDHNNNIVAYVEEYFSSAGWENVNKQTYSYNKNSNIENEKYFIWARESDSWISGYGPLYIYYNNNKNHISFSHVSNVDIDYILVTSINNNAVISTSFNLAQNYPNPFNSNTSIDYEISSDCNVELKVYDILGREISTLVNKEQAKGNYSVDFDAIVLSSGIYLYRIKAGDFNKTNKMSLLK